MAFRLCCDDIKKVNYSEKHNVISDEQKINLADLLWYLPAVSSYQSEQNSIFSDSIYDDYLFNSLIGSLGLTESDYKIVSEKKPIIDKTDAVYFINNFCVNCQKTIFYKRKSKTKIEELFRHLRNSIAHGCFNIINGMFIGFDHPMSQREEFNAAIKVKCDKLVNILSELRHITNTETMFKYALKNLGYENIENGIDSIGDLFVEKGEIKFWLEFKQFKGRYIQQSDIIKIILEKRHIDKTGRFFVLVVDSTYTNAKINQFLVGERIAVLDRKFIKEMLTGKDVLMEIASAYEEWMN